MRRRVREVSASLAGIERVYEKDCIEMRCATGAILEDYGISIADVCAGVLEAGYSN